MTLPTRRQLPMRPSAPAPRRGERLSLRPLAAKPTAECRCPGHRGRSGLRKVDGFYHAPGFALPLTRPFRGEILATLLRVIDLEEHDDLGRIVGITEDLRALEAACLAPRRRCLERGTPLPIVWDASAGDN